MAEPTYTFITELGRDLSPPAEGIHSRTLYADDRLKVIGFGFAAGEELSEHTAQSPAVMHFVRGGSVLDSRGRPARGRARDVGPHARSTSPQRACEDARRHGADVAQVTPAA